MNSCIICGNMVNKDKTRVCGECREIYRKPMNDLDYKVKYNALRSAIQDELRLLRPWYVGGSVGNPNYAIEALKSIDRLVNQR